MSDQGPNAHHEEDSHPRGCLLSGIRRREHKGLIELLLESGGISSSVQVPNPPDGWENSHKIKILKRNNSTFLCIAK